MKNLSTEIAVIVKEELSLLNNKIKGTVLLEIMKYKLIDRLQSLSAEVSLINIETASKKSIYEDEAREVFVEFKSIVAPKVNLNHELKNDLLLICVDKTINIRIEDFISKKNISLNLSALGGIVLPKGSKFSTNFSKNSAYIEFSLEDKNNDIEKIEERTI